MIGLAERVHEYTRDDMMAVIDRERLSPDTATYISAVFIDPQVLAISGTAHAVNMPTKSASVYEIESGPTGFYHPKGKGRVIFLRRDELLDYDLISDLHQQSDAHVYLWITQPYEGDNDYQKINEWFRDETYPNTYKEANDGQA